MGVLTVPNSILVSEGLSRFPVIETAGSISERPQRVGALGFLGVVVVGKFSLFNCAVALGSERCGVGN